MRQVLVIHKPHVTHPVYELLYLFPHLLSDGDLAGAHHHEHKLLQIISGCFSLKCLCSPLGSCTPIISKFMSSID